MLIKSIKTLQNPYTGNFMYYIGTKRVTLMQGSSLVTKTYLSM